MYNTQCLINVVRICFIHACYLKRRKKKSEGREMYATVINWLCQYHGGCGGPVSPRPLLNIIELNTTKTKKREGKKAFLNSEYFFFHYFFLRKETRISRRLSAAAKHPII